MYQINQNPYPKKFITINETIHLISIHGSSESEQSHSDGVGYASKYWININSRLIQLGTSLFAMELFFVCFFCFSFNKAGNFQ